MKRAWIWTAAGLCIVGVAFVAHRRHAVELEALRLEGRIRERQLAHIGERLVAQEALLLAAQDEIAALRELPGVARQVRAQRRIADDGHGAGIAPGFYSLTKPVAFPSDDGEPGDVRTCTIYNTAFGLRGDARSWRLNIGVAVCGLTLPALYVDYDNDEKVDVTLLAWLGDVLIGVGTDLLTQGSTLGAPTIAGATGHGVLSSNVTLAAKNGQAVYDVFLAHVDEASYTGLEEIEKTGGYWATRLWTGIVGIQDDLLAWLESKDD